MTIWELPRFAETAKVQFRDCATQGHYVAEDYRVAPGICPRTEMHPRSFVRIDTQWQPSTMRAHPTIEQTMRHTGGCPEPILCQIRLT